MSKLVTREYFVELWPGWQDGDWLPMLSSTPPTNPSFGNRLFRVKVVLPAFGGSAEAEEVPEGGVNCAEELPSKAATDEQKGETPA